MDHWERSALTSVWRSSLYIQCGLAFLWIVAGVWVGWDDWFNPQYFDGLAGLIGVAMIVTGLIAGLTQGALAVHARSRLRRAAVLSMIVPLFVLVPIAVQFSRRLGVGSDPIRLSAIIALATFIILSAAVVASASVSEASGHPVDAQQ